MLKNKNAIAPLPANNTNDYFSYGAILDNLEPIMEALTLTDIVHLEEALGKSRFQYFNTLYERFNKHYFPTFQKASDVSSKQHFKNMVTRLLKKIKEELDIALSPYAFFEAARGEMENLSKTKNLDKAFWLQQIHYYYHSNTQKTVDILRFISSNLRMIKVLKKPSFSLEEIPVEDRGKALCCATHLKQNNTVAAILNATFEKGLSAKDKGLALRLSVQAKNSSLTHILLVHSSEEPLPAKDKGLALHIAIKNKDYSLVTSLLIHPTKEPISGKDKGRALCLVANRSGRVSLAILLLAHSVNEPISAKDKGLALCYAAKNKYSSLVKILLTDTSKGSICGKDKGRALCLAVQARALTITEILLDHTEGEVIRIEDTQLALEHALHNKDAEIAKKIRSVLAEKIVHEETANIRRTTFRAS